MRIEELLAESQQLDELGLAGVAGAVGRGVKSVAGGIGKAAGAVVGAIPGVAQTAGDAVGSAIGGIGGGLVRGFTQSKLGQRSNFGATSQRQQQNNLDKQQQDPNAKVGDTTGQTATTQGTTQPTATTNTAQAAPPAGNTAQQANPQATAQNTVQADQQAKVGVGQINKIIPGLRTRDLQSIKTNIDKAIAAKTKQPATAPAPNLAAVPNMAVQQGGQAAPAANQQAAVAESVGFYSNFLGKNI